MDNDPQSRSSVKRLVEKKSTNFRGGKGRLEKLPLVEMSLRIDGYIRGCFGRGARYKIWDKRQFLRAIRGGKARKLSHIEQAMTQFIKTSTNWNFEYVYLTDYQGDGRKHRRIKITVAGRGQMPTQMETTSRLIGYVAGAVKFNGVAKIDRPFLVRFQETSGLPEEFIRIAWQRIKKIRGYRVKWRGVGAGRRAVVSMPYNSSRSSFPSERRFKTGGPAAPGFLQPSNRSAGPIGPAGEGSPAAPAGAAGRGPRSGLSPGKLPPPFFVGGRWVSSHRLMAKASSIALNGMLPLHTGFRVRWRLAHARNLAFMALRQGHPECAILAAWSRGVGDSHEDACDHDLRERPHPDFPRPMREPSSAVAYAWKILAKDTRSPDARWKEFFAAPRIPKKAAPPKAVPGNAAVSKSGPGSAPDAGNLGRVGEGKREQQKTIEAALAARGLKLQDLLKMSRTDQAVFVRDAFAAQKSGFDNK